MSDVDRVAQIEMRDHGSRVRSVVVEIMTVCSLTRPAMAAPIYTHHPVTMVEKEQHLSVPVVGTERPPMVKNDRLAAAPVFVKDLGAVLGCDRAHRMYSFRSKRIVAYCG